MSLKEKEKLFCQYYSQCRDLRYSAAKAGYGLLAQKSAMKLILRDEIRKEIDRLDKSQLVTSDEVISGYRRLAFGSVADALKLVYSEESPILDIEKLDLFNVSEIKRPKGGGIEIKFHDRLKALEHLESMCGSNDAESAMPFYMALEKSAKALRVDEDE